MKRPAYMRPRHWLGTFMLCLALAPAAATADQTVETVAKIKAAYLLNFLRFSQWPEDSFATSTSPISVCVLGTDRLGYALDATMDDQHVHGRRLQIERFSSPGSDPTALGRLPGCHLVFIGQSEDSHVKQVVDELRGSDALTVGEIGMFAGSGTMLALNYEDDRVIFYANPREIGLARVRLSSKILQLARLVTTDESGQTARN